MQKKVALFLLLSVVFGQALLAQQFFAKTHASKRWVRREFRKLTDDERIAQLMVVRAHSNLGVEHVQQVTALIKKYNVGTLCFFQGGPVRQALLTNYYQQIAKTPLMIAIDGEWGLGMRLDSVINYPRQLMLGATKETAAIYAFGQAVGAQCKRLGIQVNYAPDVDVNNNPDNPVINDRSFGEDKYKVARFGVAYMKGMQDANIMACAKHFPGHGDVAVDSHLDLPVINKTREALDSLELYPFREMIKAGVGSVMMGHLYIPSIDTTAHLATSLSSKAVDGLLKKELGFKGIIITDGLEMKGITKFFPGGEASTQALIAGNDMLCVPIDIPGTIEKVKEAIKNGQLSWEKINASVKKVLLAKYNLGLNNWKPIDTTNITSDLNAVTTQVKTKIAATAITLLRNNSVALPLTKQQRIAYVGIGIAKENKLLNSLAMEYTTDNYFFSGDGVKTDSIKETIEPQSGIKIVDTKQNILKVQEIFEQLKKENYDVIILGVHNYSRRPASNFGLSNAALYLINALSKQDKTISLFFGNPYALKFACEAPNLIACYEDDDTVQEAAATILTGKAKAVGTLPVTVCEGLKFGSGIVK